MTFRTFPNIFPRIFPRKFEKPGSAPNPSFSSILINTYGASEVWPLVDIVSGTTITAKVNAARNGTLTGWDLQNTAGPAPGTLAPYSDGVNDTGDIFTANLASIMNWTTFSVFIFAKATSFDVASAKIPFNFAVNGSNRFYAAIDATAKRKINFTYVGGGTVKTFQSSNVLVDNTWNSILQSVSGGTLIGAINGVSSGSIGSLVDATGTLAAARIFTDTSGTSIVDGWPAYFALKVGSAWSVADALAMHTAVTTAGAG